MIQGLAVVSSAEGTSQVLEKSEENREETTAQAETGVAGGDEGIRTLETVSRLHP